MLEWVLLFSEKCQSECKPGPEQLIEFAKRTEVITLSGSEDHSDKKKTTMGVIYVLPSATLQTYKWCSNKTFFTMCEFKARGQKQ